MDATLFDHKDLIAKSSYRVINICFIIFQIEKLEAQFFSLKNEINELKTANAEKDKKPQIIQSP